MNWYDGVLAPVDKDGNVVPLTTRRLYDVEGREHDVREIALVYSETSGGFVWRAKQSDGVVLVPALLHLDRPDSWERLADDLGRYDENKVACEYFGMTRDGTCDGCRSHRRRGFSCIAAALDDVARRVRVLRERAAKEVR